MNRRKIARRMGFAKDQEGIMNRYLREGSNWDDHLKKTRSFIAGAFQEVAVSSVAVLGSGWLLDVPLNHLRNRFQQVYLVDIRHPPQIRKKTGTMNNVELIEADLSGGAIEQVWKLNRHKPDLRETDLMKRISLTDPLSQIRPDAFISVNLLNQLDIILCDYLKQHGYFQQEEPIREFRAAIQKFHLDWITRTAGCLVTDVTEESVDRKGNSSFKNLLYTDLPQGMRKQSWIWEFDTHETYRPLLRTRMKVQAVEWT